MSGRFGVRAMASGRAAPYLRKQVSGPLLLWAATSRSNSLDLEGERRARPGAYWQDAERIVGVFFER